MVTLDRCKEAPKEKMKRILLILLFAILITSVTALSPTLEQECCAILGSEESYGDYLEEECAKLRLTEKKCESISAGWKSAQDDFERSTRPEYACCTYLGRDEEALEIFGEDFVLKTCPEFKLTEEKCAAIEFGFDYPDDEFNISDDKLDDDDQDKRDYDKLLIPGLIILAFVGWLIWSRKSKKKIPKKIKKSSIITGILMSIVPAMVLLFMIGAWPIVVSMILYSIPLFFIRAITKSKKRKYVFLIPPYLLIHTLITLSYLTSKIPEITPESPADHGVYLSLFTGIYGMVFMTLFVIYSILITVFYFRDKK